MGVLFNFCCVKTWAIFGNAGVAFWIIWILFKGLFTAFGWVWIWMLFAIGGGFCIFVVVGCVVWGILYWVLIVVGIAFIFWFVIVNGDWVYWAFVLVGIILFSCVLILVGCTSLYGIFVVVVGIALVNWFIGFGCTCPYWIFVVVAEGM